MTGYLTFGRFDHSWWGQKWGPADTWRGQEPTRSSGHRFGRSSEAARQVASLHARPHGSCSRIGSYCDLVAAPVWVQAWVGAVGRVRNASPIPETLPFLNCGSRPGNSRSFDYVVSLVQSKSPAEDADHVAFSDNSLLGRCRRNHEEACRF